MEREDIFNLFQNALTKFRQEEQTFNLNMTNMRQQGDEGGFLHRGTRRSKKDRAAREFKCGCGKDYLSFPALYTHIKNKHHGISPPNTELPSQNKARRNAAESAAENPISEAPRREEEAEDAADEPARQAEKAARLPFKKNEIALENFDLIEQTQSAGSCDPQVGFGGQPGHPILIAIAKLASPDVNELTNCYLVFGKFLQELSKRCRPELYRFCALLVRAFCECLNLYGYSLLAKLEQANPRIRVEFRSSLSGYDFCVKESSEYVCICFDFFVKRFLRSYLQSEEVPLRMVLAVLDYLASWLRRYNLSRIEVERNSLSWKQG